MATWIFDSTVAAPSPARVGFFETKASAPARCPRCGGILRDVPDGTACALCPWHAVIRETIRATQRVGYIGARAPYEDDALDDRNGVSARVFFRARRRFCAS